MNDSGGRNPEQMLSAALRAQAAGGGVPQAAGTTGERPVEANRAAKLPVARVLLAVLILGALAGALAGVMSML